MTKLDIKISGVGALRKIFADARRSAKSTSVDVGYTASYSLPVHEMVGANFKAPGTQAKFLEQPARELQPRLGDRLKFWLDIGNTLSQALMKIGLKLQRDSQKICPIATGHLRGSAFTKVSKTPSTR